MPSSNHSQFHTEALCYSPMNFRRRAEAELPADLFPSGAKRRKGCDGEKLMDKLSATCCMEWSIELEKALRSKVPGRAVEAVMQVGSRLEQWNREAKPTMAVYNLYELVPGEDRLFANAILLRLADAFVYKGRDVKLAVVRAFMRFRSSCKKSRDKLKNGILSNNRVSNYAELMRRVKVVFDSGDAESRAMALVLVGCWADFAKDSAHMRYLILSSVVSSEVYMAKAALFAAGCFCELSTDFAAVFLEMLVNVVTSSDIPPAIRWSGVYIFSRMESSHLVADRAYKTGLKLLLDSSDEDFVAKMLFPLSKLSRISPLHASEQVQLLFSFLSEGKPLKLQETSLRCLHHMVTGKGCHLLDSTSAKSLFKIVNGPEFPVALQCEALKILNQAVLYSVLNISEVDKLELDKLLTFTKTAQSLVESKNLLAMRLLTNICAKISGRAETERTVTLFSIPQDVASSLADRIILLSRQLLALSEDEPANFLVEIQTALSILLSIVGKHADVGVLLLDKLNLLTGHLIDELENLMPSLKEKCIRISSKLLLMIYRFLAAVLDTLDEVNAIKGQMYEKLKSLLHCISNCKLLPFCIPTMYSLLLHSRIIWYGTVNANEEFNERLSYDYWMESETTTLMCAQKVLNARDYWSAYRVGTQAACHGSWCTATLIFANLMTQVSSSSCRTWLNSLAKLSISEMKIQLFLLPNQGSKAIECLELIKIPDSTFKDEITEIGKYVNSSDYVKKLFDANSSRSLYLEMLNSMPSPTIYFQKWFLALRARLLESAIEIIAADMDNGSPNATADKMVGYTETLQKFTQLSVRFKRLSDEFDSMVASFIDMDRRSSNVISSLALTCALLSFTAGFALFTPKLLSFETLANGFQSEGLSGAVLIQNLLGRLGHLDNETSTSLYALLDAGLQPESGSHFLSKNVGIGMGCEARKVLSLCRTAISGVLHLHARAKETDKEKLMSQVTEHGQRILLETAMTWLQIPFATPKHLFKTRPCVGSELFAVNSNAWQQQSTGVSISQGYCMSLDLSVQVRNIPLNLLVQPIKLHCIVCCSVSFGPTAGHGQDVDDMLQMNEKLYHHVMKRGKNNKKGEGVEVFVELEANERGEGYSSCLVDVSGFPIGTYRMKWHSCCVDAQGSYWSLIPLNQGPVFTVT